MLIAQLYTIILCQSNIWWRPIKSRCGLIFVWSTTKNYNLLWGMLKMKSKNFRFWTTNAYRAIPTRTRGGYIYCVHMTMYTHTHTHTFWTGIALFEVDKKEHVRKFEDVDAINVFQYREKIEGQPPAFLQCGGFVYPLIPGKSPVLKTSDKVYMFPQLKSDGRRGE